MATISRTSFVTGDILTATQWNTQFDTVYNEFNGNIENANIKSSAAIAFSKMATTGAISSGVTKTGVTDGSAAAAGDVGEIKKSSIAVGAAISLTTNTFADVTSLSITAGDWDLFFSAEFSGTPTGGTQIAAALTTASGSSTTGMVDDGYNFVVSPSIPTSTAASLIKVGPINISISSTTTYYAKTRGIFTGGTMTAYGTFYAKRVR